MLLLFIHGWSVSHTQTYGGLPEAVESAAKISGLPIEIRNIFLGRYVSFSDDVTMDDLARAFHQAIAEQLPDNHERQTRFSCITHSTGAPVIRTWLDKYYGSEKLTQSPLQHLIMLAPANHGSALAQLGKGRLSRIKTWFQGIEPGLRILDWLELASVEQTTLNLRWLHYRCPENDFFPVVLSGQSIDRNLYSHLNSYTNEVGSDGVIRLCAANLNFRYIRLEEQIDETNGPRRSRLKLAGGLHKTEYSAFGIIPDASHTGKKKGIMASVDESNWDKKPVVDWIIRSLEVKNKPDYEMLCSDLEMASLCPDTPPQTMFVIIVRDDTNRPIDDFDFLLLAGKRYDPDSLPEGFFVDRQKNQKTRNRLTYYLNASKMLDIKDGKIGFRIDARPAEGVVCYHSAEFRSEDIPISDIIKPHQTCIVEVVLRRRIDRGAFRLDSANDPRHSFKDMMTNNEIET